LGQLRIKRIKNRLLTVLFAFAMPGAGHLYTGQHPKGLLLIAAFWLDLTAIVRLADSDGGRHLLLIVYLGIMLPVFYFISVFDSLQSADADNNKPVALNLTHGILLFAAGSIMLILVKPPHALLPWMNELAELCVGPIIIMASILLVSRSRKAGGVSLFKLGRFTAAALVLTVGVLLLWDQIQGRNDISLLGQWWPIIFILLGLEIILYSIKFKDIEKKLRFDAAGAMIAVAISLTAYVVTQYADIPYRWLDQFNVDLKGTAEFGEEKGFRYDKTIIKVPLDEAVSNIRIVNPNGQVTIQSGDVQEIELLTAVWVDVLDKSEADTIAEESTVKVNPGAEVVLEAKGLSYGANGSRKPRMNMIITVPLSLSDQVQVEQQEQAEDPLNLENTVDNSDRNSITPLESGADLSAELATEQPIESDTGLNSEQSPQNTEEQKPLLKMKVESGNGSIEIKNLTLPGGLEIRSSSGIITVSNIKGTVSVKGNNGGITVNGITGDTNLETKNGTITAASIQGNLYANTLNGSLEIKQIEANIEAETKNGKIKIDNAGGSVKADTLNGNIEVSSALVGGDWDLDSSVGEVKLAMPGDGHFRVYGSVTFGNIMTELPLEVSKKTIRGTIGEGTFRIQINATNSIAIKQIGQS